jgi:hypothetical protein
MAQAAPEEARRRITLAADHDVLDHGEAREELDVLKGAGEAEAREAVRGEAGQRRSPELELALGRSIDSGDHVEEGRLPRTVGTDDRLDLAFRHIEAAVVNRPHATEPLGDPAHFE